MQGTVSPLFELGRTVITPNALDTLNTEDVCLSITRHICGDWGDLDEHDRRANDEAVLDLERILSAYRDRAGVKFYVITEADRSATTVLLPEDY